MKVRAPRRTGWRRLAAEALRRVNRRQALPGCQRLARPRGHGCRHHGGMQQPPPPRAIGQPPYPWARLAPCMYTGS
jgi:hypothetical protein